MDSLQGFCRSCRLVMALSLACLFYSNLSIAQEPVRDERLLALHRTPNWRFITPEFIDRITQRQANLKGGKITIVGILHNSQGKSVEGAFVLLRLVSNTSLFSNSRRLEDVFAIGWSDAKGIFRFQKQPTPWFEPSYPLQWQLLVFAPGSALEIHDFVYFDAQTHILRIGLSAERVIRGKSVDAEGVPVEGIAVAQYEIVEPYKGEIECSFLFSECECPVYSDSDGNFIIGGLPANRTVSVNPLLLDDDPRARLGYPTSIVATSELNEAALYPKYRPISRLIHPHAGQRFEIRSAQTHADIVRTQANLAKSVVERRPQTALPHRTVGVRVVDAATGEGVSEIGIGVSSLDSKIDQLSARPGMQATDAEGRASIEIPRGRGHFIYTIGRKFGYITHYKRTSTSPLEYTPSIEQDEWLKSIPAGDEDIEVIFKVTPVSPLRLTITKEDGTPVIAKVEVWQHGLSKSYMAASNYTDATGSLDLPLRPVLFSIDITATTADGLVGELQGFELSDSLTQDDSATIIVKERNISR